MSHTQTAADIAAALRSALTDGKRVHLLYLNANVGIVRPIALTDGILSAWVDKMNRARQFRVEFIREAIVITQGSAWEDDTDANATDGEA